MKTGCIVVAAGRGKRAGLNYNKVFYPLGGVSVLGRTLRALAASGLIDETVLVINPDDEAVYRETASREGTAPLVTRVVYGAETRRGSVYAGLRALSGDTDTVLIHDAARPFVTRGIIQNVLSDARQYGSGVISCALTDTIKSVNGDMDAVGTLDRARLRGVQTPQAFAYKALLRAHEAFKDDEAATDDAYMFEKLYGKAHLTDAPGAGFNIKLTSPEDFILAEKLISSDIRVGTGYDVHRLTEGRRLVLCGEEIPFEKGLLGHSDADVATHALMDAMLGAAALGDIGRLFPDNDAQYEGISSLVLLKKTDEALKNAGFELINCDVTIVCQKPKLAPHIEKMRQNLASTLGISPENVSVKATTTEGLGFEGEGLGISAQSAVSLRRTVI